ncbi:hypothetical protein ScPMuIL_009772 [Solemya velum]
MYEHDSETQDEVDNLEVQVAQFSVKMSANRQRRIISLRKRVQDKLSDIQTERDMMFSLITDFVQKAEDEASGLLASSESSQFTQCYVEVMQSLDKCLNTCGLITAYAEDRIEAVGGDKDGSIFCDLNLSLFATTPDKHTDTAGPALDNRNTNASPCILQGNTSNLSTNSNSVQSPKICETGSSYSNGKEKDQSEFMPKPPVVPHETFDSSSKDDSPKIERREIERQSSSETQLDITGYEEIPRMVSDETQQHTISSKKSPLVWRAETSTPVCDSADKSRLDFSNAGSPQEFNRRNLPQEFGKFESDGIRSPAGRDNFQQPCHEIPVTDQLVKDHPTHHNLQLDISKQDIPGPNLQSPEQSVIPQETRTYGFGPSIVQGTLHNTNLTPVIVSEISMPWFFYVQPYGPELDQLAEKICLFMKKEGLRLPYIKNPAEGMVCLAQFSKDRAFYRARVNKIHTKGAGPASEVDVFYFDYGNGETVKCESLRELPERFACLPSQAICCALANIAPSNKYGVWTENDILCFRQYVIGQQLNCKPVCRSCDSSFPHMVKLYLNFPMPAIAQADFLQKTLANQVEVNSLLVNQGFAVPLSISEQISKLSKSLVGQTEKAPFETFSSPSEVKSSDNSKTKSAVNSTKSGPELKVSGTGEAVQTCSEKNSCHSNKTSSVSDERVRSQDTTVVEMKESLMSSTPKKGKESEKFDAEPDVSGDKESTSDLDCHTPGDGKSGLMDIQEGVENEPPPNHANIKSSVSKTDKNEVEGRISPEGSVTMNAINALEDDKSNKKREIIDSKNSDCTNAKRKRNDAKTDDSASADGETTNLEKSKTGEDKLTEFTISEESAKNDNATAKARTNSECSSDIAGTNSETVEKTEVNYSLSAQALEVLLAFVSSPSDFYVHVISMATGQALDELMKDLNKQFERLSKSKLEKLAKKFNPQVKDFCCAQFSKDKYFYRAVIVEIKTPEDNESTKDNKNYRVFYLDFGDSEWLQKKCIYSLPKRFCDIPPLAIHCSLAYVCPFKTGPTETQSSKGWSDDAIKKFIELTGFEKKLSMHIVSGKLNSDQKLTTDLPLLQTLLVDNSTGEEICINLDLIRLGFAGLEAADRTSQHVPSSRCCPVNMAFLPPRYNVDMDDVGVAMTGYKAQDEKRICKFYSQYKDCWRGDLCPFKHVLVTSGTTLDQIPVYALDDNQQDLLPDSGTWIGVEVSTILQPGHFYVVLPWGKKSLDTVARESASEDGYCSLHDDSESLEELIEAMKEHYSAKGSHDHDLILFASGEIVVAQYSKDSLWYRARVLVSGEGKVKVFYLDFGNTEWVDELRISRMEPQFMHLAFQAVECFLVDVEPCKTVDWTSDAKKYFRDLVDGKTLVAYIKSRSWSGSLHIELYDTSSSVDVNIGTALVTAGFAQVPKNTSDSSGQQSRRSSMDVIMIPG